MLKLTRTAKNFSLILAIAKQILKEEGHTTTEARLMQYATDSFQRLLPKLQIEVIIITQSVKLQNDTHLRHLMLNIAWISE